MTDATPRVDEPLDHRDAPTHAALSRLLDRVRNPRALWVKAEDEAAVRRAAERAAAQLHPESDCILTIALAGGSGVGKSTLINALAGSTIAEAAEQRPCTMQSTIYHHRAVPSGGLPPEIAAEAREVAHDRPELRLKVVVDTPDLDTFATQNRAATRALLKSAGLVIYVFTPEKYWDERVWSVIREEQRFSACLAVLNKADLVPTAALERAVEEIRRRFGELGKPDIAVLRVSAARHVPRADGSLPPPDDALVDEFSTLRAYIEHELREGDIARMRRDQRVRVVEHLGQQVDRLVPAHLSRDLEALATQAGVMADAATDVLSTAFSDRLATVEAEAAPLIAIRRHQAFHGPFRVWLAVSDLFSYGIPRLVRRLRSIGGGAELGAMLGNAPTDRLDEVLVQTGSKLRDAAFASGLPVERWRTVVDQTQCKQVLSALGDEIQARFDEAASAQSLRLKVVARTASVLGTLIPLVLAGYALTALIGKLWAGGQTGGGIDMLTMVLALTLLAYILLHAIVNASLVGLRPQPIRNAGRQAIHTVLQRTFGGWIRTYREDLESDATELRASVESLRALALSPSLQPARGTAIVPAPRSQPTRPQLTESDRAPQALPAPVNENPPQPVWARDSFEDRAALGEPEDVPLEPITAVPAPKASEPAVPTAPRRPAEIFRQAVQRHAAATRTPPAQ